MFTRNENRIPAFVLVCFILACTGMISCQKSEESDHSNPKDSAVPKTEQKATISSTSGEAATPEIKPANTSFSKFIPSGYSVLDSALGNLNGDNLTDAILILKKNGEEKTSDVVDNPEKRPLLILTGNPDNTFTLAARNDNTVFCVDCGGVLGDPYNGITIKNGYFSVEHYGGSSWRWARIITYKYSEAEKGWFLHKDGSESFHASNPEKVETIIKTTKDFGKVPFVNFDIYKE